MRTIQISTDVFAAIWAARQGSENSEDEILRRQLNIKPSSGTSDSGAQRGQGVADARFGFSVEEGFEISRTFKGQEFRARASAGAWVLISTGVRCASLNELSTAIGAGVENAWNNWFFTEQGVRKPISALRDSSKISRRKLNWI